MLGSAWAPLGSAAGSHEGTPREGGGYVTLASALGIMQHHLCQIPLSHKWAAKVSRFRGEGTDSTSWCKSSKVAS